MGAGRCLFFAEGTGSHESTILGMGSRFELDSYLDDMVFVCA